MVPDRVGRQRKLEKAAASQTSSGTTPKMPEDTHQNCLRTSACAKDSDTPKYRDTLRGNILFCDPPQRLTAIVRDTSIRQPETGDVTRKPKVDDKRVSTERLDSPITLSSEARQRPIRISSKRGDRLHERFATREKSSYLATRFTAAATTNLAHV